MAKMRLLTLWEWQWKIAFFDTMQQESPDWSFMMLKHLLLMVRQLEHFSFLEFLSTYET